MKFDFLMELLENLVCLEVAYINIYISRFIYLILYIRIRIRIKLKNKK